jgi:hypothetical protein
MAVMNKTHRGSPQFCRASVRVTHSANCFFGEFGDEKKFASFSPEFLVLTRTSLALRTHPVGHDDMPSVAPGPLKKEAFAGANSAGIRDELQS